MVQRPVDITPDDACKSYTDNIIDGAYNIIPKKVVCNHSQPFMTKELKNLQDTVRKTRKQYHKKSDPNNWPILQKVLNNYSKAYVKARKLWWSSFCNQANSDDSKFWKIINKVNNGDTKCVVQPLKKKTTKVMNSKIKVLQKSLKILILKDVIFL